MNYEEESNAVRVQVTPHFVATQNHNGDDYYVYSYDVEIENRGDTPLQLISRHWIIRDGDGREEHIIGDGVVGEQPTIEPGAVYSYQSGCPLPTPTGNMRGKYDLVDEDNRVLEAKIPLFFLRPDLVKELH